MYELIILTEIFCKSGYIVVSVKTSIPIES